jgi:hypothetical protein
MRKHYGTKRQFGWTKLYCAYSRANGCGTCNFGESLMREFTGKLSGWRIGRGAQVGTIIVSRVGTNLVGLTGTRAAASAPRFLSAPATLGQNHNLSPHPSPLSSPFPNPARWADDSAIVQRRPFCLSSPCNHDSAFHRRHPFSFHSLIPQIQEGDEPSLVP